MSTARESTINLMSELKVVPSQEDIEKLGTGRNHAEIELEDIQLLQSLSMELISEDDPQVLYEKIMDAAMQIMSSQYASLQMLHREKNKLDKLQLLAFRGFNPAAAKFWE